MNRFPSIAEAEDREARPLFPVFRLEAEHSFQVGVGGRDEAQLVPTKNACVPGEGLDVAGDEHGEVHALEQVRDDAVVAIGSERAHGAEVFLLLAEHEVHEDERLVAVCEEFGKSHRGASAATDFFELVILDLRVERERAPQCGDAVNLFLQCDLCFEEFFAAFRVLGRFVGKSSDALLDSSAYSPSRPPSAPGLPSAAYSPSRPPSARARGSTPSCPGTCATARG